MAHLRLHADDGENGRQRIHQSTSANCKSAQNQHAEAVCKRSQRNRANGSRVEALAGERRGERPLASPSLMKGSMTMKPLQVLVVGWTATTGGIEHFLMAYCGKMNRERVQFDFLCRFSPIACQKEAEKIGKIYTITRRSSDIMRYYREINDFSANMGTNTILSGTMSACSTT